MLVQSNMLPLGTLAPAFRLPDMNDQGAIKTFLELSGVRGTWVMFLCNHCPFVKHIQSELVACAKTYLAQGVGVIAISSNDVEAFPDDAPEAMTQEAQDHGYPFSYLYDASQATAREYQAACTPDFYVFDDAHRCVYRGRFDASTPRNDIPITGQNLRSALDCLLAETAIDFHQVPSMGCNIKWKVED